MDRLFRAAFWLVILALLLALGWLPSLLPTAALAAVGWLALSASGIAALVFILFSGLASAMRAGGAP